MKSREEFPLSEVPLYVQTCLNLTLSFLFLPMQGVCDPVVLEGSSSLVKLLSLRLAFSAPFTNVLSVKMEANLKQLGITASIQLSKVESMVQNLVTVLVEYTMKLSLVLYFYT